MNLREKLAIPADRPLDVLIHTRYSTDEQSQSSIDGQINACTRRSGITAGPTTSPGGG